MKYSKFGERFRQGAGIVSLMDDLGKALNENPELIFMGGGNPGHIEPAATFFKAKLMEYAENPEWLHGCLGVYQSPQGDMQFRQAIAQLLNECQGWPVTADHIAISNGSQSAFFLLFNMIAGETREGHRRTVLLPLVPEYIGYSDTGIDGSLFHASRPKIQHLSEHRFKYQVDFDRLPLNADTAALCVSRPTNPTGNMITTNELIRLDQIARAQKIPLIIDGAYGLPFPNLVFNESDAFWNDNTILVLSLSKLGLPGCRTGIVVGHPDFIQSFTHANTVASLASGNLGPYLLRESVRNGELLQLCRNHIQPFYQTKMQQALDLIDEHLDGFPYLVHQPEGAIFLWLWFPNLPITSQALYERLKNKGMLIVAGHHFFPGLGDWQHKHECIRVSYAQPYDQVEAGIRMLGKELKSLQHSKQRVDAFFT